MQIFGMGCLFQYISDWMTSEPFNPAAVEDYKIDASQDTLSKLTSVLLSTLCNNCFSGSKMCKPFTSNLAI
jgi:hypothetical protein